MPLKKQGAITSYQAKWLHGFYIKLNIPALNSITIAYDDFQLSMPIMADLFKLNTLARYYAYFILTPTIVSVIFYLTTHNDLRYVDALFMCFSAISGTGLDVVGPGH